MLEENVSKERDMDLNQEEDIIMEENRQEHWIYVDDNCKDKSNINSLRWDIYTREKEDLIKRDFLVSVTHPKGGGIVCTCVKDNMIKLNEYYESIGLSVFGYKIF